MQDDRTRAGYIRTGLWKCGAVWNKRAFNSGDSNGAKFGDSPKNFDSCDHQCIMPTLISLHWLPVRWRIKYSIILLTYRALPDFAPEYIVDIISPYTPGRRLRCADTNLLTVPRHDRIMERSGRRGFSVTALDIYLPIYIHVADSLELF